MKKFLFCSTVVSVAVGIIAYLSAKDDCKYYRETVRSIALDNELLRKQVKTLQEKIDRIGDAFYAD